MIHLQQIYKGESIGLQLSPNVPLAGWEIQIVLSTTPNDYAIRGCYPSTSSEMPPLVCENGILKLHVPSVETGKLSEGIMLLQIILRQGKVVKMGTFRIAEVVSHRTLTTDRETIIALPLTIESKELYFTLDIGPNAAMDGRSAYECYLLDNPASSLTEEQYAALPVEAAAAASAAGAEAAEATAAARLAARQAETAIDRMRTAATEAIGGMQAASEEAIRQMRRAAAARYEAAGIRYNEATGFYELNGLADITDEQAEVIYAAGPLRDGIKYQYSGNNFSPLPSNPRTNLCYRDWKNSVDLTEKFRGNAAIEVALLESSRARMGTGANSPYYVVLSSASSRLSYCFDACKTLRRVIGILDCSRLSNGTDGWMCPLLEEVYLWGVAGNCDLRGAPRLVTACVHYMIRYALPGKAITITCHAAVYDAAMADPQVLAALEAQPMVALASA